MRKLHIHGFNARVNVVDSDRMETMPLGTVLYCSADELRVLADLLDDPKATVMQIRYAAFNICPKVKGKPVRAAKWKETTGGVR